MLLIEVHALQKLKRGVDMFLFFRFYVKKTLAKYSTNKNWLNKFLYRQSLKRIRLIYIYIFSYGKNLLKLSVISKIKPVKK